MNVPRLGRTHRQLIRFVLVGMANTLVTGAIFLALSAVMPSAVAYTVAFLLGLGFVVVATPRLVFLTSAGHQRRVLYAAWYGAVYLVGLLTVSVLSDLARLDRLPVVIGTLAVTSALSFVGGRILFDSPASEGRP